MAREGGRWSRSFTWRVVPFVKRQRQAARRLKPVENIWPAAGVPISNRHATEVPPSTALRAPKLIISGGVIYRLPLNFELSH